MFGSRANKSILSTVLGVIVAVIAIVGTQVLGWEWGDGRLIPTLIGCAAAGVALYFFGRGGGWERLIG